MSKKKTVPFVHPLKMLDRRYEKQEGRCHRIANRHYVKAKHLEVSLFNDGITAHEKKVLRNRMENHKRLYNEWTACAKEWQTIANECGGSDVEIAILKDACHRWHQKLTAERRKNKKGGSVGRARGDGR